MKLAAVKFCALLILIQNSAYAGILYPRSSETREILSLDGIWDFALSDESNLKQGHEERWFEKNLRDVNSSIQLMAVPSSYNDISTDFEFRDHFGSVWYQRKFYVPNAWSEGRVWIRFASVTRQAEVWINGASAVNHSIGHLPFQAEISDLLNFGEENSISVSVDNTLSETTIPPGWTSTLSSGRKVVSHDFDFFNYAGIDHPVVLYTTPKTYIDDISVTTDIDGATGIVNFDISLQGSDDVTSSVTLLDKSGKEVASADSISGSFSIENANLWWPYLMDPNPGYLYNLEVKLLDSEGGVVDRYVLAIGIRKLSWDSDTLNINNKPVYLRGFSRHEDSDFRGSALDLPIIVRDFELLKWTGANSFRAANYPYSEETLDLADRYGIMVIDESPAINIKHFTDEMLANHKQALTELVQRDKNRPSVIIWSVTKDSGTNADEADSYCKSITDHVRSLDSSRPLTVASALSPDSEKCGQYVDLISVNTLEGWSGGNNGNIDIISNNVGNNIRNWKKAFNIPVIVAQYGAESMEGLHFLPSFVWSEEFQDDLLSSYFELFDELRSEGVLIGEITVTFIDYKSEQSFVKVGGNKKGVFTRNRQPKSGAHFIRQRYWALADQIDNASLPKNLIRHIAASARKDEL